MIILAREARGLTQQDLADKISTQKAHVSKIEHGDLAVSNQMLESISQATAYPISFFYQPGGIMPVNLAYRKRKKVPSKLVTPIEAKVNIVRNNVQFVTRALDSIPPIIPTYHVKDDNSPVKIAQTVRQILHLSEPVIADLTAAVELQGILISSFPFGTERIDSRAILTDDQYPIIILNKNLLADRWRFSLAFELGHLLMHTYSRISLDQDINHEANLFAAELLMPANDIVEDFKSGLTLPLLAELKRKWKVSMISLLYRADDLGFLTTNQKRYLIQQFNQTNIRRREPPELDVAIEKPILFKKMLQSFCSQKRIGISELSSLMALELDDFLELYS